MMNERIQNLIAQATKVVEPNDPDYRHEVFDREKFAELIVRECCDIITLYNIKDDMMFDMPPVYVIKKHFGVK